MTIASIGSEAGELMPSAPKVGLTWRMEAEKRDPELANQEPPIECPTCENLLDDVDNVSTIVSSACDGIQVFYDAGWGTHP